MILRATGKKFDAQDTVYPNVNDGVEGMYFIQQSVASNASNGAWLPLKHPRAESEPLRSGRSSIGSNRQSIWMKGLVSFEK